MDEFKRTADVAVAGLVPSVRFYAPLPRSPQARDFETLVEFAHVRLARRLPRFNSELTRAARDADERHWDAAARAYVLGAHEWARFAEPTVDRLVRQAMSIVAIFVEHVADILRRRRAIRPAAAIDSPSPATLLVMTLTSAACAPPASALNSPTEGPRAA